MPSALHATLIEAAARALAKQDGQPLTEPVLQEYREDARAVVEAVLAELEKRCIKVPQE